MSKLPNHDAQPENGITKNHSISRRFKFLHNKGSCIIIVMKIAILMDDIANINPKKDSSLAMMLEAVRRGWEVWTFDTTDLFADKSGVYACTSQTLVTDNDYTRPFIM
jgi:hypothetical protein